jgi:hypothetical protein
VTWNKNSKKWTAVINHIGNRIYIGTFKLEKDAARAVNVKCRQLNKPIKNPEVEVLDYDTFKQQTKVIRFFIFTFSFYFYVFVFF